MAGSGFCADWFGIVGVPRWIRIIDAIYFDSFSISFGGHKNESPFSAVFTWLSGFILLFYEDLIWFNKISCLRHLKTSEHIDRSLDPLSCQAHFPPIFFFFFSYPFFFVRPKGGGPMVCRNVPFPARGGFSGGRAKSDISVSLSSRISAIWWFLIIL